MMDVCQRFSETKKKSDFNDLSSFMITYNFNGKKNRFDIFGFDWTYHSDKFRDAINWLYFYNRQPNLIQTEQIFKNFAHRNIYIRILFSIFNGKSDRCRHGKVRTMQKYDMYHMFSIHFGQTKIYYVNLNMKKIRLNWKIRQIQYWNLDRRNHFFFVVHAMNTHCVYIRKEK